MKGLLIGFAARSHHERLLPIVHRGADIRYVSADGEFASGSWLEFLTRGKIPYRLRIKANYELTDKHGSVMSPFSPTGISAVTWLFLRLMSSSKISCSTFLGKLFISLEMLFFADVFFRTTDA